MQPNSTKPNPDDLLEQACAWLTRLHSGNVLPEEVEAMRHWRETDVAHEQAWHKAETLWQALSALPARAVPGSSPLPREYQRHPAKSEPISSAMPWLTRSRLSAFAMLLIVICYISYPPLPWRADLITPKGEIRTYTLDDGSRVTLNSDSALALDYGNQVRRVELLQGEAFFGVAKDASRPFVVFADSSQIRAVGTAFGVERHNFEVKVELVEGVVTVSQNGARETLHANQTARIENQAIRVASVGLGSQATWRKGYLQFDGLPLADAVAEINRYRPGRIVLLNSDYRNVRVSGLFFLNNLDQAMRSLTSAVPGLQTLAVTRQFVILR